MDITDVINMLDKKISKYKKALCFIREEQHPNAVKYIQVKIKMLNKVVEKINLRFDEQK